LALFFLFSFSFLFFFCYLLLEQLRTLLRRERGMELVALSEELLLELFRLLDLRSLCHVAATCTVRPLPTHPRKV
jgi:hypothetical protein